jgi:hypothetical protein
LLLVIVALAAPAVGRGDVRDQTRDPARDQARALFLRGQEHFAHHQYRAAFDEFRQSYALSPRPLLLYDIGLAALGLEQRDEALTFFRRFVATIDRPTAERRNVETIIAKLERGERVAPEPRLSEPAAPSPAPPTPTTPAPAPAPATPAPAPAAPTLTPAANAARPHDVTATTQTAEARRRAHRRGLIIGLTAGAVVVAGGVIALGIAFGTSTSPVPTIGSGHLQ